MNLYEYFIKIYLNSENIEHTNIEYKALECSTAEEVEQKTKGLAIQFIQRIIDNGESLEEYCSKYGGSITTIKRMACSLEKEHSEIYKQFRELCKGPSEQFYENMKEIAHEIAIKGKSFDVFDYYCATKLHPLVFQNICESIIDKQEFMLIKPVLTKIRTITLSYVNFEAELIGKTIIKSREISYDEKIKIAEYLNEHNIPDIAFKFALRKYVDGDERLVGYVNQTEKVKI